MLIKNKVRALHAIGIVDEGSAKGEHRFLKEIWAGNKELPFKQMIIWFKQIKEAAAFLDESNKKFDEKFDKKIKIIQTNFEILGKLYTVNGLIGFLSNQKSENLQITSLLSNCLLTFENLANDVDDEWESFFFFLLSERCKVSILQLNKSIEGDGFLKQKGQILKTILEFDLTKEQKDKFEFELEINKRLIN